MNTVTEEDKQRIANTFITALKNNDWDTMGAIITPNTTWSFFVPGIIG